MPLRLGPTGLCRAAAPDKSGEAVRRRELGEALAVRPEVSSREAGEASEVLDRTRLRTAIAELPPEQRSAIALFYFEEMSVAEVAVALDVPAGTVKTRLMHARRKLARGAGRRRMMRDVDQMIDEALDAEERDLLRSIGEEPGFFSQAFGMFSGPTGWVHVLLMIVQGCGVHRRGPGGVEFLRGGTR